MIGPIKVSHIHICLCVYTHIDVCLCVCVQRGKEADRQRVRKKQRQRETGVITRNMGQIVALSLQKVKCLHGSWDATMRKD